MGNKIRVMLVDDHLMFREKLFNWIGKYLDMHIVGEAANGLEAVTMARSLYPDVILMDVRMEKMNGLEATKIIMSELPKTCIIGLSINDDRETVSAMKAAGAAYCFSKDCNMNHLLSAIRNCGTTT
jgi:DNA-binding NarL/FixJ family response regulator